VDRERAAEILEEIALLLEMKGESPFKSRAYARAATLLRTSEEDFDGLVRAGRLETLPGIGAALAAKLTTLWITGRLPYIEELRGQVPHAGAIRDLLQVQGLGVKRARQLAETLRIGNLGELEYACRENRLLELPGFGPRAQEKILRGIERLKGNRGRILQDEALEATEALRAAVAAWPGIRDVAGAGPLRRAVETVDAIVLVAAGEPGAGLERDAAALPGVTEAVSPVPGLIEARLRGALPLRLAVVPESGRGCALVAHTGSEAHLAGLRERAAGLGLDLRPDGLLRGGDRLPVRDEADLYRALGLPLIPPERREGRGEIEAAAAGRLPALVQAADLRGVLHVHSTWSDGRLSIEEIVRRCAEAGYEYVGITDHSRSARYARGLTAESLRLQQLQIDEARARHPGIRVLKGSEVDILPDGSLDYPDEVLATLDFVVASVHSQFGLPSAEQTRRIVRALRHPRTTILGHPTGRLLLARDPYAVDLEAILGAAAAAGVAVELNAHPQRLDLDSDACRRARELGARVAIDPDAHDAAGLAHVRFGVGVARRAGLGPADVLNTVPAARLHAVLERRA
jgi:DNA polymerase (family 10)